MNRHIQPTAVNCKECVELGTKMKLVISNGISQSCKCEKNLIKNCNWTYWDRCSRYGVQIDTCGKIYTCRIYLKKNCAEKFSIFQSFQVTTRTLACLIK